MTVLALHGDADIVGSELNELERFLVPLLAHGHSDFDISEKAEEDGFELSIDEVREHRKRLNDHTIEYVAKHSDEILATVARVHKPFRVRELDAVAAKMIEGIDFCASIGKWNHAAKAAETLLKINARISEEVHDLKPIDESVNIYMTLIQRAPREKRAEIASRMRELQVLIDGSSGVT